VLKCKAALVKTKFENVRASVLQRKLCERLADVVGMLFAQPIKAGLNLVDAARAIRCKNILEWSYVYTLSANAIASGYMRLPFTWSILRDQLRTEYPNKSVSRRFQSVSVQSSPSCSTLTMDEKVMDIFLFRNISFLLFLKSFKKAERHSNKTTDLSWLINCARVFADEGRQVALSLVVYEGTRLCQ